MENFHKDDNLFIENVTLMVKDIDKSLIFYQEALGFTLLKTEGNVYTLGTTKNVLVKLIHNEDAIPLEKTNGLYHLALLLPNRKYLGQLMNHFIKLNQKIVGGSDHGVSEALYLADPDGNGIEIYSDRESYTWEYNHDGEVMMITEMMDYEGIIKDAYKEPWKKLPEDTVMGHIHFHVNNIDLGREFFIDTLGFDLSLNYGGSAVFMGNEKYHHHVGMNIWNGIEAINRPYDMVGLVAYNLNVPKNMEEALLERINKMKFKINNDENGRFIYDINNSKVYF